MTTASDLIPTRPKSLWVFRLSLVVWATLLGMQCVWLVSAELVRPAVIQMPTDKLTAATAAKHSEAADRAASIGGIRGDLWAESAFTHAESLWSGAGSLSDSPRAGAVLERAARDAPHRSDVWLLVAGLAQRFAPTEFDPTEALKMSYYTGSSEMRLIPFRLMIAIKRGEFDDAELHEFIGHDIRLLLDRKQIAPITDAYMEASAKGKNFLAQTVKDIDPSAIDAVRKEAPVAD